MNFEVGQITVTFSYKGVSQDVLLIRQKNPTFGKTFDRARIAETLGP